MDNTFTRALVGFVFLTAALAAMALVALNALSSYAGAPWWAMLLIVIVALVAEISIYTTTLHEPIHDWIREPKRRAESNYSDQLSKTMEWNGDLRYALQKLYHATLGENGFAISVRRDSGISYPWPALDEAEVLAVKALERNR